MERKFLKSLFLILLIPFGGALAQFQGKITDFYSNLPVANANIIFGENKTISDKEGHFEIEAGINDTLVVSHINYVVKKIVVGNVSFLNMKLIPKQHTIDNVLVTSFNENKTLKRVSGNVSVVYFNENKAQQSITLLNKLSELPGVSVQSGTFNTNRIVIRGIGSRSQYSTFGLKAYVNNIPVTTGDGSISLEDFPSSFFSSGEVIKGPASSNYGAGVGGVVRLQTKKYSQQNKMQLHMSYGSYNTLNGSIRGGFKKGNFSVFSGVSRGQSNGYRQNSSFYRNSFILVPEYSKKRVKINGLFLVSKIKAHIPSSVNESTFVDAPYMAATNWLNVKGFEEYNRVVSGLGSVLRITDEIYFNTSFFLNTYNSDERRPYNINSISGRSLSFGTRSFFSFKFSLFDVYTGIETMKEEGEWRLLETAINGTGNVLNSSENSNQNSNLFLSASSKQNKRLNWLTSISLSSMKYETTDTYTIDNTDHSRQLIFPNSISPRVGVNYELIKSINVYASFSQGFSPPSFEETLNPDEIFNDEIKPALGMLNEFGMRGRAFMEKLYYDFTFYSLNVKNLWVVKRLSETVFYNENAGKTSHNGIEGYLTYTWSSKQKPDKFFITGKMFYNYNLHMFKEYISDSVDYSGKYLPGIPMHDMKFLCDINYAPYFFSAIFSLTGKMYLTDENEGVSGKYNVLNISMGRSFNLKHNTLQVKANINNCLNTAYASMVLINAPAFGNNAPRYYYPATPLNFNLSVIYSL